MKISYKLMLWFLAMVKHLQSFPNSKFAMSLQYVKKEVRDELEMNVKVKVKAIKVSYKVILLLLMGMVKDHHSNIVHSK